MGDQARQRARPWLIVISIVQLVVSLLVAGIIVWVLSNSRPNLTIERYSQMGLTIGWVDLIIEILIGLSVILLGQAIVAYAIFAGKALPRRELRRQWHNTIFLAAGYGLVVGWSLTLRVRPIYSLLLTTLLMTLFYALLIWRDYTWRGRYLDRLRPFITSQHLYEHLLTPTTATPTQIEMMMPFYALCEDVLEANLAHLIPLGPLAPLVTPISYPANQPQALPALNNLIKALPSPQNMVHSLDPLSAGGAQWAVPLWSERGLIGLLLLGPKLDGSLYTEEEFEIARASSERLVDTRASAEIARRLMALQRQRLTESQLLDRQTRRVLHDDVLPQLHTALLMFSDESTETDVIGLLSGVHGQISNLLHEVPSAENPILARQGLIKALRQIISDELPHTFDEVAWHIDSEAEQTAQHLPPLTAEVILYAAREALRNAARHGRGDDPQRPLHLTISIRQQQGLVIQIDDDGVGLQPTGASPNGSGQGLALHSTMLAVVGGALDVKTAPGASTRVRVTLPHEALSHQVRSVS